jgi:RNA polymerase sigma-70 factor (ECF subfamily)
MQRDGLLVTSRADYVSDARPLLERALVARFGLRDGMDAASDAIEYAITHWDRVSTMENPTGYLFKLAHSKAIRSIRRSKRLTALAQEPMTSDHPVDIDLQRALMELPWGQRVAVMLVYSHGHTYASAAEVLDVPVTTITNHLHRGLAELRKAMDAR